MLAVFWTEEYKPPFYVFFFDNDNSKVHVKLGTCLVLCLLVLEKNLGNIDMKISDIFLVFLLEQSTQDRYLVFFLKNSLKKLRPSSHERSFTTFGPGVPSPGLYSDSQAWWTWKDCRLLLGSLVFLQVGQLYPVEQINVRTLGTIYALCFYHKDTEPLYHYFMYSLASLLSGIYPLPAMHSWLVTSAMYLLLVT